MDNPRGMPLQSDDYRHWNRYFAYIFKKYRITRERFWKMWKKQGGKCAICRRDVRLVTDHDHKTGRFRGLLCYYCNGILGKVEKIPVILKNIPTYLRKAA
jgi:hypothetical protein